MRCVESRESRNALWDCHRLEHRLKYSREHILRQLVTRIVSNVLKLDFTSLIALHDKVNYYLN